MLVCVRCEYAGLLAVCVGCSRVCGAGGREAREKERGRTKREGRRDRGSSKQDKEKKSPAPDQPHGLPEHTPTPTHTNVIHTNAVGTPDRPPPSCARATQAPRAILPPSFKTHRSLPARHVQGMKRKNAPRVHFSLLVLCYLEVRLRGAGSGEAARAGWSSKGARERERGRGRNASSLFAQKDARIARNRVPVCPLRALSRAARRAEGRVGRITSTRRGLRALEGRARPPAARRRRRSDRLLP